MIHLDTQVVVWVYGSQPQRLSGTAVRLLEDEPLGVSPMVELELEYLFEIGRVSGPPAEVFDQLRPRLDLRLSSTSFAEIVAAAVPLTWTRDPFDRLIVANALADDARLLTADRRILDHLPEAVWD